MNLTKKPKANAYIDGANMFYTQMGLGWFIDFEKLIETSDFRALGKKLKDFGKKVIVYSTRKMISYVFLEDLKEKIEKET